MKPTNSTMPAGGPRSTPDVKDGGSRFVQLREPPRSVPQERRYRCGHCLADMPEPRGESHLRCESCGRRNALPHEVWVCCDACAFEQPLPLWHAGRPSRCTSCHEPLLLNEVVLRPLVRQRARRRVTRASRARTQRCAGQAGIVLLMLAAALLLALKVLGHV